MSAMEGQKVVVVGAGPVGALAGLYAAARDCHVEIYELRSDLRDPSTVPLNFTKSINLALSERGINSMRNSGCPGLIDSVLADTIPMHGRMIHGEQSGELFEESQAYDAHGRFIRAADRGGLNKRLLDRLEAMPNVKFFFNHKLTGVDFKKKLAWFERRAYSHDDDQKNSREIEISFDFMIGADGAHSTARYNLMKYTRMFYQQEYIDTLWCEFHMEPKKTAQGDDFKLSPNHLHIWPGGKFMFIAIPSLDKSFTCTLFLPAARFAELDAAPSSVVPFFQVNFPGVVPDLIPAAELQAQYLANPHLPLITIKCAPYHFEGTGVVLGDAAHAMVPFYGQGMNAGLEDVRVLFDILDGHAGVGSATLPRADARAAALAEYSARRARDAFAINDLALRNYKEMRADVVSPVYRLRKRVEEALSVHVPSLGWATQYSRISFGNLPYAEVERLAQKQGKVLKVGFGVVVAMLGGVVGWWGWRLVRRGMLKAAMDRLSELAMRASQRLGEG